MSSELHFYWKQKKKKELMIYFANRNIMTQLFDKNMNKVACQIHASGELQLESLTHNI